MHTHAIFHRHISSVLRLAAVTLGATVAIAASASAATITSVSINHTTAAPLVTVSGSGFGSSQPASRSDALNGCGYYGPSNGRVYGQNGLGFGDSTNAWEAGFSNSSTENCIGLVVERWSPDTVVFSFGSAYDTYGTWYLLPGDHYGVDLRGYHFNGVASF